MNLLYLLYDSLMRRQSAIGHSILMKKSSWESVRGQIASLTPDVLLDCAKRLEEQSKLDNPDVTALLNGVKSIGAKVPNSHQQRSRMLVEMKSMVVRYSVSAIWFTLNPSDLRNPLVLKLSGVVENSRSGTSLSQFCAVTATMNSVAVASFFHQIITAFFGILVCAKPDDLLGGIFSQAES
ncbi:hypothetical protein Q9L58_010394 [Maublancomyces gigas]|uniref:Helitron helicase-like domain-containing protein n=1 Tax=Discina gigas TaxID=1032678 RepID=A0ABR3G4A1_9PEZI